MTPGARNILAIAVLAALTGAGLGLLATGSSGCALLERRDPAAAAYGAERMRCVTDHDAAADARACMVAVDRRYAPLHDGGRP